MSKALHLRNETEGNSQNMPILEAEAETGLSHLDGTAPARRGVLAAILACFFLSGVAGLIYQVAWGKALGLVFGHTVYAIATVLAVFMGGLAWGSAWFGKWSERRAPSVAAYGWVELGVAVTGALSLAGLAVVKTLYVAAYHTAASSWLGPLALRLVGAAVVFIVPTFLMGGTLPILVRGLTRSSAELGTRLSRLYWVNTAGAVIGTLFAGFVLLPAIGLRLTVAVSVGFNLLAGVVALICSRSFDAGVTPAPTRARESSRPQPYFLLAGFGVVGATAMAYEIGWTRLLATMLGSSTYAFTLMLATFLAGIVLGSFAAEKWLARGHSVSLGTFAGTQTATALAAIAFLALFQQLPRVVPPLLHATHASFGGLVLAQFVSSALALLPTAMVFGFNFPIVTVLIAGDTQISGGHAEGVGRAYAANTFGAIVGAIATGFWLVPWLGGFKVLALAAALNVLLALLLVLRSKPRRVTALVANLALLAGIIAAGWSGVVYNRTLAHFGTALYWTASERLTPAESADLTDLVFAADGLNASITVVKAYNYLALLTNGKADASNVDTPTQLLLGHLGAVLHPAPRRVLVIGFGGGMTTSALARYPEIERIDCVEIEPAVIQAAAYLGTLNRGVLRDPRLHLILDDARNFLLTSNDTYDLIVSEPSNPWIAGVASLFTEEYYRAARKHLAPGGMFVQWLHAYWLYPDDLRMVLGTFVSQFPQVTLWRGNSPDLILVARTEPAPVSFDRLRGLWSNDSLRADFMTLGLRQPEGLVAFYLLDDAALRQLASDAPHNTDDHTILEYRAPRGMLARNLLGENQRMILSSRRTLLPPNLAGDEPGRPVLGEAAAETLLNRNEEQQAWPFLQALAQQPPSAHLQLLRGRLELSRNRLPEARAAFEGALAMDKLSLDAELGLAEVTRRQARPDEAQKLSQATLARQPNSVAALESMALLERDRKNWKQAAEWQAHRIAADPGVGDVPYCVLANYLVLAGDPARAQKVLVTALEREPYSYVGHRDLAALDAMQSDWKGAETQLEFVVRYFPDRDPRVYTELASAYRSAGDEAAARKILRKGLRIFPNEEQLRPGAESQ